MERSAGKVVGYRRDIRRTPRNYDSNDVFFYAIYEDNTQQKIGYGYSPKKGDRKGQICIVRCPRCKRENYALAVSQGLCAWCGFDAAKDYSSTGLGDSPEG